MQNVFPARELYNSNPCREMWDSEQFSQNLGSCSQGSQNSSSDLFSQSRMSQQKGLSSFDVWSQPTNSQQKPEEEPAKYYMKYMTKPPLFSSELERQSRQQKSQTAANYKELIEIQRKKTAERDDRDVLDSFISLLKDYTKEVKAAMDSFKDSIDTTLASKAEQVASAACESADLIKKLKDDLLESFGCLRKDMKENEELKGIIAKQNEKIAEQDSQIKMLHMQLEDCRTREIKALEKQDKYLEREDKLVQKLDEISCRQQPAPQVPIPLNPVSLVNQQQTSECLQCPYQRCVPQNPAATAFHGQSQFVGGSNEITTSGYVRLHHIQSAPHSTHPNPSTEVIHPNVEASSCREAAALVLDYYHHQAKDNAVVPSANIRKQSVPSEQSHQIAAHPTAAIAPMRSAPQEHQSLYQQQGKVPLPVLKDDEAVLNSPIEVVSVLEKQPLETGRSLTSPGVQAAPILLKTAWPKQSPVAAVHPQVRIKREDEKEKIKSPGSPCAKKVRKEDPFDIFVFDLTSSSDEESNEVQKINITSIKAAPKHPAKIHATRSKKIKDVGTRKGEDFEKTMDQRREASPQCNLPFKVVKRNASDSSLRGKVTTIAKCNKTKGRDDKSRDLSDPAAHTKSNTPHRPIKVSKENGIPRSKVAQNVFQKSKATFKRNLVAAKRVLSFDASIFDGLEEDKNIQQITESIRRHAQKRRVARVF